MTFGLLWLFYFLSAELFRKVAVDTGATTADWGRGWAFALWFGLLGGSGLVTALIGLIGNRRLGWKGRVLAWRMGIAYAAVLFMSLAVGVYQHTVPLLFMPLVVHPPAGAGGGVAGSSSRRLAGGARPTAARTDGRGLHPRSLMRLHGLPMMRYAACG